MILVIVKKLVCNKYKKGNGQYNFMYSIIRFHITYLLQRVAERMSPLSILMSCFITETLCANKHKVVK